MLREYNIRKFRRVFGIVIVGCIVVSCSGSSKISDGKDKSKELDKLISNRSFEIISDRAMPMATASMNSISNAGLLPPGSSAGQISLIGNANYVKVINDSVAVYLPYFGERQMGGGYDRDGAGIEFNGIPEEMNIVKDSVKQRYDIRLKIKDDSEVFTIAVTLFPNLSSMINVNSSQRFPIRYSGSVRKMTNKQ